MAILTRIAGLAGVLLLLLGSAAPAYADTPLRLMEQKIKAGLLYNFMKHIIWPPAGQGALVSPMMVCVYGEDDFEEYLQPMDGRSVNQRKLEVRHISAIGQVPGCDVLFLGDRAKGDWGKLQTYLRDRNVLTVSDYEGFAQAGGMIEYHQKDRHIGAIFNLDAFDSAGLQVNDSLLELSGVETLYAKRDAR